MLNLYQIISQLTIVNGLIQQTISTQNGDKTRLVSVGKVIPTLSPQELKTAGEIIKFLSSDDIKVTLERDFVGTYAMCAKHGILSCMAKGEAHDQRLAAYEYDQDNFVAVLWNNETPIARTIVNTREGAWVKIYGQTYYHEIFKYLLWKDGFSEQKEIDIKFKKGDTLPYLDFARVEKIVCTDTVDWDGIIFSCPDWATRDEILVAVEQGMWEFGNDAPDWNDTGAIERAITRCIEMNDDLTSFERRIVNFLDF